MPTQRQLAFDLSLSVQTVSRAYDKLVEAGKIVGEVGRGTFVRAASDDISMPFVSRKAAGRLLDMSILKPVLDHAHEEAMQKTLRAMARSLPRAVMGDFRQDLRAGDGSSSVRRWLSRKPGSTIRFRLSEPVCRRYRARIWKPVIST